MIRRKPPASAILVKVQVVRFTQMMPERSGPVPALKADHNLRPDRAADRYRRPALFLHQGRALPGACERPINIGH